MSTTLGALYDEPAPTPVLELVKPIILSSLPTGWRNWMVSVAAIELQMDQGHKARFAIPSVELFQVLAPGLARISERRYRSLKMTLLAWPLSRALVYAPTPLSVLIRGSKEEHDAFISRIETLRSRLLSRKELNEALASPQTHHEQPVASAPSGTEEGSVSNDESSPSYEPLSPLKQMGTTSEKVDGARVTLLEAQMTQLQATVANLVGLVQTSIQNSLQHPSHLDHGQGASCQHPDISDEDDDGSDNSDSSSSAEEEPDPWGRQSLVVGTKDSTSSFFDPLTEEKDPLIKDPSPELLAQAVKCQRLGKSGWNRVFYKEADNRLKRAGVFQPLEMNPHFANVVPPSDFSLRKQERLLATITHGLLAQRQAFRVGCDKLRALCPAAIEYVDQCFLAETSDFRLESEALLQFTCGKRAEVLADRRKAVEPKDSESRRRLRLIPPSVTHLYDEDALSGWVSTTASMLPRPNTTFTRKRTASDFRLPPAKKQRFFPDKDEQKAKRTDQIPKYDSRTSKDKNKGGHNSRHQGSSYRPAGRSRRGGTNSKRQF